MNNFEAFNAFKALKLHFNNWKYDYHKYNGTVNSKSKSISAYNTFVRSNHFIGAYSKLANESDPIGIMVSHLCESDVFITDLIGSNGKLKYQTWIARQQALPYTISKQLNMLHFNSIKPNDAESILQLFIKKELTPEVASILLYSFVNKPVESTNPIYKPISIRLLKYHSFIRYDVQQFKRNLSDIFISSRIEKHVV